MLKKKLVTIVAAAFCVALVTAQQSGVNKVTTDLIEDGAIDSLKFGTEDGSGVIFGQYDNSGTQDDKKISLGWGNSLSDTLWLSVFDSWYFKNVNAKTTLSATNDGTADDGINVDYTATERSVNEANVSGFKNDLGVGVGINNTLGFQLVWAANYDIYKNAPTINGTSGITTSTSGDIKSESNNPGAGTSSKTEWTKITNHSIYNNFTVNFKGVGVEDIGDIAFFAKLNKVYFNWHNTTRSGDYTESSSTNGKTTSEGTKTGKFTEDEITPGLNFDLGLNVIDNDVATVKFVYEDDFNMTFKPRTNESSTTSKNLIASSNTEETTTTNSYKVEYGKYLAWKNKFEPKLVAEFNVAEPLKLKAQLTLPVTLSQEIDEAGKYEKTSQTDTFNRAMGYTSYSKTTVTGRFGGTATNGQNSNVFTTKVAPKLSAGFVYEVTPGKFNVNFGASATPVYTWTTTTLTNANINTIKKTESKDQYGNVTSGVVPRPASNPAADDTKYAVGDGVSESKTTELTTGYGGAINLGATWFFTENVSFDVYFINTFGGSLFDTSNAGASVTVKF